MKTLLERLNPEIVANLYDEQVKYPISVGELLTKLSENVAVTELTLNELTNLSIYSPKPVIKILDFYDMFENI